MHQCNSPLARDITSIRHEYSAIIQTQSKLGKYFGQGYRVSTFCSTELFERVWFDETTMKLSTTSEAVQNRLCCCLSCKLRQFCVRFFVSSPFSLSVFHSNRKDCSLLSKALLLLPMLYKGKRVKPVTSRFNKGINVW